MASRLPHRGARLVSRRADVAGRRRPDIDAVPLHDQAQEIERLDIKRHERPALQFGCRSIHQVQMMRRHVLRTRIESQGPHTVERRNIRQSTIVPNVCAGPADYLRLDVQVVPRLQQVVDAVHTP